MRLNKGWMNKLSDRSCIRYKNSNGWKTWMTIPAMSWLEVTFVVFLNFIFIFNGSCTTLHVGCFDQWATHLLSSLLLGFFFFNLSILSQHGKYFGSGNPVEPQGCFSVDFSCLCLPTALFLLDVNRKSIAAYLVRGRTTSISLKQMAQDSKTPPF